MHNFCINMHMKQKTFTKETEMFNSGHLQPLSPPLQFFHYVDGLCSNFFCFIVLCTVTAIHQPFCSPKHARNTQDSLQGSNPKSQLTVACKMCVLQHKAASSVECVSILMLRSHHKLYDVLYCKHNLSARKQLFVSTSSWKKIILNFCC